MNIQDPIRSALRDLVRSKRVNGWCARVLADGTSRWTVSYFGDYGLVTPPPFTTDEVNDLVGQLWNL